MGFKDKKLVFSASQVVGNAGSEASDYEIDCAEADANLGAGTPLVVEITIEAAFTGGTSLTFELQHSAAGSSYDTLVQYPAVLDASLTKGAKFQLMVPDNHRRFLQMYYTDASTHTAGTLSAVLQPRM